MAAVNVTSVRLLNNPAKFLDPFSFEIEYECLTNLQDDLEWSVVYVGSAESDKHDQQLESVLVGPVVAGNFKFVLEANPPDCAKIPDDDIVGVTVILLTCSYRNKEFIRIGYYVNNEYASEELRENPPDRPQIENLWRSILTDHPRVTRFPVPFDEPEQPEQMAVEQMGFEAQGGAPLGDSGHGMQLGSGQQEAVFGAPATVHFSFGQPADVYME